MQLRLDAATLRRSAPFVAPVAVLAIAYGVAIHPRLAAARDDATRTRALRVRALAMRHELERPRVTEPPVAPEPHAIFDVRTPDGTRVPDLLEALARRALAPDISGDVRNLLIETGDRVELMSPSSDAGAPRVAADDAEQPDPRFALFSRALAYTPITISFESTYARAGDFLWRLRGLPTIVEIASFELAAAPAGAGRVRVSVLLLAYQRTSAPLMAAVP